MRPHRRQPTRLPCPWDSPGKNTGVGCHFLLQCMKVKSESGVAQLCPTLPNPMDCSPPGSSVHGVFQARVLEWGAIVFWVTKSRTQLSDFQFHFLEKEMAAPKAMAPHSSTVAWKIPWTEEPGRLQSMGSLESDTTERLHFHFSLSCIGEGNGNPLQCSCLENPMDGGAWWAAVRGVTQSRKRLKRLSSSSSSRLLLCLVYCK